jgi:simple sugar transport system permease protein
VADVDSPALTVPQAAGGGEVPDRLARAGEAIAIPAIALAAALVLFGLFMAAVGQSPAEVYGLIYKGAFGSAFAWQNTLQRAAPLILTALCVALPARAGLVVIGGEGALVLGGLAAAVTGAALAGAPAPAAQLAMAAAGMATGAAWIGLAGALRHRRGVNETIGTLLLNYIAIALLNHLVEGPLRDPASLNKPSTRPIAESHMLPSLPGLDVHAGLLLGVLAAIGCWVLVHHTVHGFAARIVGGNVRAARLAGLPVGRLVLLTCGLGGASAGLAGVVEVAAVHGSANATLVAGYGYSGVLVSFLARHDPLAIVPVAVLVGGLNASGGLLQRRLDLPDATVLVLQGITFMAVLAAETLRGRWRGRAGSREP